MKLAVHIAVIWETDTPVRYFLLACRSNQY